jgi:catalase
MGLKLPKKNPPRAEVKDMKPSPALSIQKNMKLTLKGRGRYPGCRWFRLQGGRFDQEGGGIKIVAAKVAGAKMADGTLLKADGQLAGTPSQIFDAVAVILSQEGCETLSREASAVRFVMDAFGHLKAVGASEAAKGLLEKAGVQIDEGVTTLGKTFVAAARQRFWDREEKVRLLA